MKPLREVLERMPAGQDPFRVTTLDRALWATRKLAAIRRKEAEAQAEAAAQIALITDWLQGVTNECAQEASYFEGLLAPWVREQIADGKKKSVKLPGATLGYRTGQPRLVYDEAAVIQWAEQAHPEALRVTKAVDKKTLRAIVLEDGEVVRDPGSGDPLVQIEPPTDTFYVKFTETEEREEP